VGNTDPRRKIAPFFIRTPSDSRHHVARCKTSCYRTIGVSTRPTRGKLSSYLAELLKRTNEAQRCGSTAKKDRADPNRREPRSMCLAFQPEGWRTFSRWRKPRPLPRTLTQPRQGLGENAGLFRRPSGLILLSCLNRWLAPRLISIQPFGLH